MADQRDRKIVELVIDASGVEAGERRAALAYDHLGERAAAAQAKATAAIQQSMRIYESQLPQSIERTAAAYDRLRSKTDPVLAAQLKLESEMTRSLQVINRAVLQGVTTQQDAEQQILRLRNQQIQQLDEVRRAHERVNDAQNRSAANDNASFRRQNLGYQLLDVVQSGAGGANPGMILAQQGPQILQLYAGQGGVKSALADVAAIAGTAVGAIGALPLALTAAGTAAIIYAKSSETSLANADKLLQQHQANVKALAEAYGVAERSAKSYSEADRAVSRAATLGSLDEQQKLQVQAARELRMEFGSMQTPGKGGQAFFGLFPDYKPFEEAFRGLDNGIRSGRIEGEKFIDTVSEISKINPQYEEFGNKILKAAQQFLQINTEITKTKDLLTQIGTLPPLDPLGVFSPERDAQAAAARTPSLFQQQQDRIAALRQEAAARSPAEREAAARASAAAQFNPSESSTDRDYRIELAGTQARIAAERQLIDAQRDRAQNMQRLVQDQQTEIDLIGKTGGEVVALRKEYGLTSQLRLEAARNGVDVDQKELDLIKQRSQELGRLTDAYNKAKLASDLRFEREQLFRSSEDQQIASRLLGAGLPVDLTSQEAQVMRDNMRIQELRNGVKGFFTDFRDGLLQGDSIGKALGDAIVNALNNVLTKITDRWIEQLVNSIVGTGSGGGLLGSLGIGGGAANDNFAANTTLGKLIGANDNLGLAPVIPVTRAPLGNIAAYAAAIKSIESSGNYSAMGPVTASGDRAYGAYQVMGANVAPWTRQALGYSLTPSQYLGSPSAQDAVFQKIFGGYVSRFGPSGAAQAWFGGPGSVGRGGNAADMLGTTGTQYVEKFNSALSQLSGTTESATGGLRNFNPAVGSATQSLGTFGNGLGQLGNTLSSGAAGGGANSGGGLLGWLSNLFGGANSATSGITASSVFNVRGYADGTDFAPGGVAMVGERGPELVNLPRGSQVVPNRKTEALLANARSPANVNVKFNVVNNTGSSVRTERRDTNDGPQFDVIIDEVVAAKLSTPGSRSRRAAKSNFGLSEGLARR
ncbi:phage tail length tape measure family protein [Rhizobium binae]|uniref:phage tail length tape measure family protein n=1 Tax=Rhizobium binae TaxID=1138190 RepID=UPI001C831837|nr:phage tail length tape measure family protein [Rhizobium binae]MBX4944642.1 hypothetical protein [Rhizobium binae]MBX4980673.1 hypothetical protein [Rhizobium binae]